MKVVRDNGPDDKSVLADLEALVGRSSIFLFEGVPAQVIVQKQPMEKV